VQGAPRGGGPAAARRTIRVVAAGSARHGEGMGSHYATVARALETLAAEPARAPALGTLAGDAGLSPAHFQRLFTRMVGVSPKRFAQALVFAGAEARLAGGDDVLAAATAVGLSAPARLHDLSVTLRAMTPGELRRGGGGLVIRWSRAPTLLGEAFAATTERGLCALQLAEPHPEGWLRARWPRATLVEDPNAGREALDVLRGAARARAPLALHVRGTPFQVRVWQALLEHCGAGETTTYGELAAAMGRTGAARAVGGAVGANPIAVLIPCHRVLRRHGALGGYRWGLPRKRILLAWESAVSSRGGGDEFP